MQYTGHERQEERLHCKAFEQTQASAPSEHTLVFLKWEKFLPGSDGQLIEQLLTCSASTRCTDTDGNQMLSSYHGVWGSH